MPVDTVNRVVPELIRDSKFTRPVLGIEIDEDINQRLTELLEIKGVVILNVPRGTSAAAAGLKGVISKRDGNIIPGDIVTAIEGKPVDSVSKLVVRLDDFRVGDKIRITVSRQGETREVQMVLQAGG